MSNEPKAESRTVDSLVGLLTCPFCGGQVGADKCYGEWRVECYECSMSMRNGGSLENIKNRWNKRVQPNAEHHVGKSYGGKSCATCIRNGLDGRCEPCFSCCDCDKWESRHDAAINGAIAEQSVRTKWE